MTLRVILQIVPFGDEDKTREIARLDIFNKGEFSEGFHHYGVIDLTPKQEGMFNQDIYHQRQDGPWMLVAKALNRLDVK